MPKAPFEEYFSEQSVIDVLCRMRVRRSKSRHDALFFRRLSGLAREPREQDQFDRNFPPRSSWHRYRPSHRENMSGEDLSLEALRRAVLAGARTTPPPVWLSNLRALVGQIRDSALKEPGHRFSAPRLIEQQKAPNSDEYRPVSTFSNIIDKVVDSLVGRYFRENLDIAFEPCSVAFRAPHKGVRLDRDTAIAGIWDFRARHSGQPLAVAECDIKGFFDCVSHEVARTRLRQVMDLAKVRGSFAPDSRAIAAFESYLSAYSFPQNVKGDEAALKKRTGNPKANYKWPASGPSSLRDFYSDPYSVEGIGVPQGGALSCVISNVLLDWADKEVQLAAVRSGAEVLYYRYCDDMIIVSTSVDACRQCFESYGRVLNALRLPYHRPEDWLFYGIDFFEKSKTKAPYIWHGRKWFRHAPWIQFLGYQIRYDGLLRVRKKSIEKHRDKSRAILEEIMEQVSPSQSRVNRGRLLFRFEQRLIAMSVGRAVVPPIGQGASSNGPLPMCWAAGFRSLHNRPFVGHPLRGFDRLRAKLKSELAIRTQRLVLPDRTATEAQQSSERKYHGHPFSYAGQFTNKHGQTKIFHPYRPDALDRAVLGRCFECRKRMK